VLSQPQTRDPRCTGAPASGAPAKRRPQLGSARGRVYLDRSGVSPAFPYVG
jgi:hypothetical protein